MGRREELAATWLEDHSARNKLDDLVRNRFASLSPHGDITGPHSIANLCDDLRASWGLQRWFLVSCAASLLAELLLGSRDGGAFPPTTTGGREEAFTARVLKNLRDACFHPALVDGRSEKTPLMRFVNSLRELGEHKVARDLELSPATLRSEALGRMALRWINTLGRIYLMTK